VSNIVEAAKSHRDAFIEVLPGAWAASLLINFRQLSTDKCAIVPIIRPGDLDDSLLDSTCYRGDAP
jgi:hypothetical protein